MAKKPIAGRKRRVIAAYRPHLADIATLYLDSERCLETTARRVRDELDLPLTSNTLRAWLARSAEFRSALEEAEIIAADAAKADPEVRSPKDVAWLQARQKELRDQYEGEDLDEKQRASIRKEMMAISAALRAEEKHIADLRDRAARREFSTFLRNFINYVKTRFGRQADVIVPVLRQALQSLSSIMKGGRE